MPASVSQNGSELMKDPQLWRLDHFLELPHQEGDNSVIEGARIHFSRSKNSRDTSTPISNRDMKHVLHEVLGY